MSWDFFFFFFFFAALHGMWDLSPQTRDQTHVPAVAEQSPNHWTVREVPGSGDFNGEDHLVECLW